MSRLPPPPVEYVGYSKHASFTDTAAGTRHYIGSLATPSTTDFEGAISVDAGPVVMPGSGSMQRCAFFLSVEGHSEAVPVVSRSLRVALSSL